MRTFPIHFRRVTGPILIAIVVTLVAWMGSHHGHHVQRDQSAPPAPTHTAAGGAQVPDPVPYVAVAVDFTTQWARHPAGEDRKDWLARLTPYATRPLLDALAATPTADPDTTVVAGANVQFVAATSALVIVPLADGAQVAVTVLHDGGRWLASQVNPAIGDQGQATTPGSRS